MRLKKPGEKKVVCDETANGLVGNRAALNSQTNRWTQSYRRYHGFRNENTDWDRTIVPSPVRMRPLRSGRADGYRADTRFGHRAQSHCDYVALSLTSGGHDVRSSTAAANGNGKNCASSNFWRLRTRNFSADRPDWRARVTVFRR